MLNAAELAAQTRMTKSFIDADPVELVFENPGTRISDGSGGWVVAPGGKVTATVRMIPQNDAVPEAAVLEGIRPIPEYILMGMPDAGFLRDATFSWMGRKWILKQVHDKPQYERKADVHIHG